MMAKRRLNNPRTHSIILDGATSDHATGMRNFSAWVRGKLLQDMNGGDAPTIAEASIGRLAVVLVNRVATLEHEATTEDGEIDEDAMPVPELLAVRDACLAFLGI